MVDVTEDLLKNASESLLTKLIDNFEGIKNFVFDASKYLKIKENYLNKISGLQFVKTINDFEDSKSLYDFFVNPHLVVNQQERILIESLNDLKSSRQIVLQGIVGQGKSILMRHLAIQELLVNNKIALFFELRYLDDNINLDQFLQKIFEDWMDVRHPKVIKYALDSGEITLFFDGFDELSNTLMPKVLSFFDALNNKYPKLKIVVSSRPETLIDKSSIFKIFKISTLNFQDQNQIVKNLVHDEQMQLAIIKGIKTSAIEVKKALITPLMVNLFVFVYKADQLLPQTVKDFYERLFDLVLRKHDSTKIDFEREMKSKLTHKQLQEVFRLICYICLKNEKVSFDEYIFRSIIKKSIDKSKIDSSVDHVLLDIVSVICFIVKEGAQYTFIHKSIMEYYAAEYIAYYGEPKLIYSDINQNYIKYRNVCKFLNYIDEYDFYVNFLKDKYSENIDLFKEKKFIDNVYIKIDNNNVELLIVFNADLHSYITYELRLYLYEAFLEDLNNLKFFNRVSVGDVQISVGRLYGSDDNLSGEKKTLQFIDEIENFNYSRSTEEFSNYDDVLKHLQAEGFKKISLLNMNSKYPNLTKKMHNYVTYTSNKIDEINNCIDRNRIDDDYMLNI